MARPLASDGLRVAPPVSLEISCPQVRPRGLTTVPFSFRLTNRSSPELADAGTEVTARVALCRGAEHSELLDAPLPLALPVGAEHSLELPLHLPAFHGWYELQAQLLVGDRPLVEARLDLHLRHHVEELFLEVTNACNFRCDFCPQGELKRKPAILDLDLARKVLGDLRDMGHAHPIRLHLLGEPLLYPHFEELIGIVHEFGQTVRLATNGPRFDEATVEAILRSRVDELMISLNTPEREGFEERRGTRMDYDTYMASIHRMVDAVIERGSPPRTWVNVLYDGRRLGEPELLDEAHAFARPWFERCAALGVTTTGDPETLELLPDETHLPVTDDLVLQWTPYHDWGDGEQQQDRFCVLPWMQLAILVDGKVTACCLDHDGEIVLGDVRKSSVEEIWEGPRLEALRRGFLAGERIHPKCKECTTGCDRAAFPQLT